MKKQGVGISTANISLSSAYKDNKEIVIDSFAIQ
jgi:endonuclease III